MPSFAQSYIAIAANALAIPTAIWLLSVLRKAKIGGNHKRNYSIVLILGILTHIYSIAASAIHDSNHVLFYLIIANVIGSVANYGDYLLILNMTNIYSVLDPNLFTRKRLKRFAITCSLIVLVLVISGCVLAQETWDGTVNQKVDVVFTFLLLVLYVQNCFLLRLLTQVRGSMIRQNLGKGKTKENHIKATLMVIISAAVLTTFSLVCFLLCFVEYALLKTAYLAYIGIAFYGLESQIHLYIFLQFKVWAISEKESSGPCPGPAEVKKSGIGSTPQNTDTVTEKPPNSIKTVLINPK